MTMPTAPRNNDFFIYETCLNPKLMNKLVGGFAVLSNERRRIFWVFSIFFLGITGLNAQIGLTNKRANDKPSLDRKVICSGGVTQLRLDGILGEVFVFELEGEDATLSGGSRSDTTRRGDEGDTSDLPDIIMPTVLSNDRFCLFPYPNPATGILNVTISSQSKENTQLIIYNSTGEQILTRLIKAEEKAFSVDVSDFSVGIYYLIGTREGMPRSNRFKIIITN